MDAEAEAVIKPGPQGESSGFRSPPPARPPLLWPFKAFRCLIYSPLCADKQCRVCCDFDRFIRNWLKSPPDLYSLERSNRANL